MNIGFKLAMYMLFISSFDNTSTIPILSRVRKNAVQEMRSAGKPRRNDIDKRLRRQDPIVQPSWTSDQVFGDLFPDFNVKITDRKLVETEAIRKFIHHTIENGTFAVDLDYSDFPEVVQDSDLESEPEIDLDGAADFENTEESEGAAESNSAAESEVEVESEDAAVSDAAAEFKDVPESEAAEAAPESEAASESNAAPESAVVIEPKVEPVPEPKPIEEIKPKLPPPTPRKSLVKQKKVVKVESVDNPFLTWLKSRFMNPWSLI